ncbi:MAG: hypothetical protein RRY22_02725 [Bacilli bacterium]
MIGKYSANMEYLNAFINVNSLFTYNTLIVAVLLLSTLNTLKIYEDYRNIIIRYKSKKKYFIELIKIVLIINLIIVIINYILLFTGLNFFAKPINSVIIPDYGVSTIIYTIFIFVKKLLLFELLTIMFLIINKNLNKNLAIIISVIMVLCLFIAPYNDVYVNSFGKFQIFYWDYFVVHRYSSFILELSFFGIYFCISFFILYLLSLFTIKKIKVIGD